MIVLDSSAVLAFFLREPGGDVVESQLSGAAVSAVNVAELATKLADHGIADADIQALIATLDIEVHDFDAKAAFAVARLRGTTRRQGLSLGDRACLALAQSLRRPVLTADRAWADLGLGVEVRLIR